MRAEWTPAAGDGEALAYGSLDWRFGDLNPWLLYSVSAKPHPLFLREADFLTAEERTKHNKQRASFREFENSV